MTAREALKTIQQFVDLAVQRRVGNLPQEQRSRMEALDEKLRDLIDGAKPKPRTIENPSAVKSFSQPTDTPTRSGGSASGQKSLKVGGLAQELERAIENKDQKKIRDVSTTDLPKSLYTPSSAPAFLADYYDEEIVPTGTIDLVSKVPTSTVLADGTQVELMDEVKVLFGMAEPPPKANDDVRAVGQAERRSSNPSTSPQLGRPTIVHYVNGGTKRGEIAPFEPHTGMLYFLEKDGSIEEVSLSQVLAVFFGLLKGEAPTDPTGERMIITLINDKKVAGLTNDYEEGGEALTIVPEPRRGNIDRIWIPATAVKAIEMG